MHTEVVLADLPPGEGPVWCADGTLVITHLAPGCLRRIWPASGRHEIAARTGGGANSAYPASDGGFVVTQNGGMDFSKFASALGIDAAKVPYHSATSGLQRVLPNGEVRYLADRGFQAPNDLVVAADGTLYFTDPPHLAGSDLASGGATGRFWAFAPGGALRCIAEGFQYCNGVALSPAGRLLIVEKQGLLWIDPASGAQEWFVEKLPGSSPATASATTRAGSSTSAARWTTACACSTSAGARSSTSTSATTPSRRTAASAAPTGARCSRPSSRRAASARSRACPLRRCRCGPGRCRRPRRIPRTPHGGRAGVILSQLLR